MFDIILDHLWLNLAVIDKWKYTYPIQVAHYFLYFIGNKSRQYLTIRPLSRPKTGRVRAIVSKCSLLQ